MRRCLFAVVFLLLAASRAAFAQGTTGLIVGTVKDESGAALPGVTVSLKGEAVVGTQTSVTNAEGFYRFVALPPGTYDLTFALTGFGQRSRPGIRVALGATVVENAGLKVGQLSEEVTVSGEAPVIDTQSNKVGTNYDKDWVRNAPIPRFTFFDFLNSAPGVSQTAQASSRSTSLGSSTSDNSYQLDGTDFTAPYTGAAWPWPNTDAVEEIEVLSLGAPAEYGGLQGAVFNVVTRQGSNTFHGDANFYYQTQDLTSNNTKDIKTPSGDFADACPTDDDPGRRCPYHRDKYNDATLQLSGPIVKDKLWFFGSYQYQRDYDSQGGTDPNFPNRFGADRIFFKANYQMTAKHKLMFAYHDDFYRIPLTALATALSAPSTIAVEHGHNPAPNLTYTGVLSNKTYVEARVSGFYGKDHGDPLVSSEPRVKPRYNDLNSGQITGGIYDWYDGDSWKTGVSGKVSHFADNFLGASHDFKFGVQYNEGGHDYVYGYNDYIYTYGSTPAYGYTQSPFHLAGKMKGIGFYADDTVRASSRLTLNVGLRYDYSKGQFGSYPDLDKSGNPTGTSSPANDKLFAWSVVSPRIGFNYKLTGDGKTVLKAHYGRYYRGIITQEFDDVGPSITPKYSFSGTYDAAGNPEGTSLYSDNSNQRVDPNFKDPYTDQFVAGFEREVVKNLGLEVNYSYKRGEHPGGWLDTGGQYAPVTYHDTTGTDATGKDITVLRLVNDPSDRQLLLTNPDRDPTRMFSRFQGLTVQLTKRMSSHWQMVSSVVFSKATGRIGSSLRAPNRRQEGFARAFGQNPNDYINTDDLLIEDRPLVIKTSLVYELPKGFLVGVNFRQQSGRPWARQVRVSGVTGVNAGEGGPRILAERLDGHRRVDDQTVLDLRAQKEFRLGGGHTNIAFLVDALNLLNDGANEGIGQRDASSSAYNLPTLFINPRRLMLGAKLRF